MHMLYCMLISKPPSEKGGLHVDIVNQSIKKFNKTQLSSFRISRGSVTLYGRKNIQRIEHNNIYNAMKHGRHVQVNNPYTIKPVLRSHIEAKKKWPFKTGDLKKEVQFIRNFLRQNNERIF